MKKYYTYYINPETGFKQVFEAWWLGDMIDKKRQAEQRIFSNLQAATVAMQAKLDLLKERQ